jgi:hypothetical protein
MEQGEDYYIEKRRLLYGRALAAENYIQGRSLLKWNLSNQYFAKILGKR